MVSHNTQKLQEVARHLNDMNIEEDVGEAMQGIGVSAALWPLMTIPFVGLTSLALLNATKQATIGLDRTVTGLGEAIDAIADYYTRQEEQYGDDWDALGEAGGEGE